MLNFASRAICAVGILASSAAGAADTVDTIPVQEQSPDKSEAVPPEQPSGPAQLETVVVTATKREQSIRDIPESITAFTGENLEKSGKINLYDYIQESPGVVASQGGPGFTRLTFRGISTDTNPYAGNAQPIGIFIGDVPFTDPYIANIVPDLSAFDLKDVEVLKGPQGTLFGGAALSGAIRYQLEEPDIADWKFRAFTQYAHPAEGGMAFTSGVAFNAPVSGDNLAVRVSYVRRAYPGVMDDLRTGEKDVDKSAGNQIRAQLLWKPEDWKFKFTHLTQDFFAPDQLIYSNSPTGPRSSDLFVLKQPSRNDFGMDSLEIGYDFSSMRVVSLTSRVHRNAFFTSDLTLILAGTPPPNYPQSAAVLTQVIDNSKNFSQEIRLQSTGDGPFKWLVGAYFFDYKLFFDILIDTPENQSLFGPGSLFGQNPTLLSMLGLAGLPQGNLAQSTSILDGTSNAKSQEKAVFADASYKFWDSLDVSIGGRFYQTSVFGGFTGSGALIAGNENNGAGTNTMASIAERGFNPKLSATFKFNRHASLFLLAAKGFRFGGVQDIPSTATNGVPPTFKSDTLWDFELGLRTNWLHNTLQADITPFYNLYKNPIITQQTQGIPINYNTNVSAAISRGFEGSIVWNTPISGLYWSFAGGLTDAHITKTFTAANGTVVQPGQEMPGAAREQFSTSLSYSMLLWRLTLLPTTSYTYVGKGYNDITHDIVINGYGSWNAGLVLGTLGFAGNPRLAINVSNILDTTRPDGGASGKTLITQQPYAGYLLNTPRTLMARISVDF